MKPTTAPADRLPPTSARRFGTPQYRCDSEILAMAFSSDGTLWSIENPGTLKEWAVDGKLRSRSVLSEVELLWVFGPGAKWLASGSDELTIFDLPLRQELLQVPAKSWVTAIAFHPDGSYVVTGHDDGSIQTVSLVSKEMKRYDSQHRSPISAMRFSGDGNRLAVASEDRTISVWNEKGGLVKTLAGHTDRIPALAWKPGTHQLVSAGWDTTARVWNIETGEPVMLLNAHDEQVVALAFSPDGSLLACADASAMIHIWSDVQQGQEIQVIPGDQSEVRCLTFSSNGEKLAVGGADRVIHVWDPRRGTLIGGPANSANHSVCVIDVEDRPTLVSNGCGSELNVWDIETASSLPPTGLIPTPLAVAGSPDGRWIVGTNAQPMSRLHIWDARQKKMTGPFEGPRAPMTALAFAPDSRRFASGCRTDGTAWVWSLNGEPMLIIPEASEGCTVEAIAWHPNNVCLAVGGIDWLQTGGADGAVAIWDVDHREKVTSSIGGARSLAFSPTGRELAVATTAGSIRVLSTESMTQLWSDPVDETEVNALLYSSDGQYLVCGCEDASLRVWNATSGIMEGIFQLDSPIRGLSFDRNSQILCTGNANSTGDVIWWETVLLQRAGRI